MAGFRFDLQRVLEMRIREEDKKKSRLAEVQGRINRQLGRIDRMQAARRELLHHPGGGVRTYSETETALRGQLFGNIERSVDGSRFRIASLQQELEQARQAYIQARQQRMAMEKLKEKRRREWEQKQRLLEARLQDESAAQQFIRKSAGK